MIIRDSDLPHVNAVLRSDGASSKAASILIYGGVQYEPSLNSTTINLPTQCAFFEYNIELQSWKILPSGPPVYGHTAVLDSTGSRLVIWGGFSVSGLNDELFDYRFDKGEWNVFYPDGIAPPPTVSAAAVTVDNIMHIFGGHEEGEETNDTLSKLFLWNLNV